MRLSATCRQGFDDAIVRGFAWNDTANHNDSRVRYQLLHDIIAGYTAQGVRRVNRGSDLPA